MCHVFKIPLKKINLSPGVMGQLIMYKFLQSCSVQGNTDPPVATGLAGTAGGGGTQGWLWAVTHTFAFNSATRDKPREPLVPCTSAYLHKSGKIMPAY